MKILQINKYSTLKGGTETVLFKTISLLKKQGHEVALFSIEKRSDISTDTHYALDFPELKSSNLSQKLRFLFSFFYNREAARQLECILEKEKPDIVHIHLFLNSFSVSILPVLKKKNIPVVMTLHDYRQICPAYLLLNGHNKVCEKCKGGHYYNCLLSKCSKGLIIESLLLTMEMYFRRLFYPVEKYVDTFICVSAFSQMKHKEFIPKLGLKSIHISNPAETMPYESSPKGDYILYYGRLSREKGIPTLLQAARILSHLKFKIAGSGEMGIDKDTPDNVDWLGFKSGTELKNLIRNSSFVVIPSEWNETFGLVVTESFSLSKPVIAARIGALPELVSHKMNGFLFKSGDVNSLVDVLSYADSIPQNEYNRMAKNANSCLCQYSEQGYTKQLYALYNSCIINKQK